MPVLGMDFMRHNGAIIDTSGELIMDSDKVEKGGSSVAGLERVENSRWSGSSSS